MIANVFTVVVVPDVKFKVCATVFMLVNVLKVFDPVIVNTDDPVLPPIVRLLYVRPPPAKVRAVVLVSNNTIFAVPLLKVRLRLVTPQTLPVPVSVQVPDPINRAFVFRLAPLINPPTLTSNPLASIVPSLKVSSLVEPRFNGSDSRRVPPPLFPIGKSNKTPPALIVCIADAEPNPTPAALAAMVTPEGIVRSPYNDMLFDKNVPANPVKFRFLHVALTVSVYVPVVILIFMAVDSVKPLHEIDDAVELLLLMLIVGVPVYEKFAPVILKNGDPLPVTVIFPVPNARTLVFDTFEKKVKDDKVLFDKFKVPLLKPILFAVKLPPNVNVCPTPSKTTVV